MIPKLGASGIFTLDSPFAERMLPDTEYTCVAIQMFVELIDIGVEPYEEYYEPFKIEKQEYDEDVENGVAMITLRSSQGVFMRVPDSYIQGVPNANGLPYHAALLSVDLGVIPSNLDLTSLMDTIRQVTEDYIGIQDIQVQEVAVSDTTLVSAPDHDRLEAARKANITVFESDRSKAIRLADVNAALQQRIGELEDYIKSTLPP